jgi:hypothetical protein
VTGILVGVAVSAVIMFSMFLAAPPTRPPRRPFDLAPGWLGPGVRGVSGHRALPEPGRDWVIA